MPREKATSQNQGDLKKWLENEEECSRGLTSVLIFDLSEMNSATSRQQNPNPHVCLRLEFVKADSVMIMISIDK